MEELQRCCGFDWEVTRSESTGLASSHGAQLGQYSRTDSIQTPESDCNLKSPLFKGLQRDSSQVSLDVRSTFESRAIPTVQDR